MKRKRKKTEWVAWATMPMAEIFNWVEMWEVIETKYQLLQGKPEWAKEWERLEADRPQFERDLFSEVDQVRNQAKAAACEWIRSGKVTLPEVPPLFASHGRAKAIFCVLFWWAVSGAIAASAPHASQAWLAMIPQEAARLVTRIRLRIDQKKRRDEA